jgi:hypothetical protein
MPNVRFDAHDCPFDPAEGDQVVFSAAWDHTTLSFKAFEILKMEPLQGIVFPTSDKVR